MLDQRIKIDNVASATGFDAVTLLPASSKVITYHIAHFGPFTLTVGSTDYNADHIAEILNKHLKTLQDLGAIAV